MWRAVTKFADASWCQTVPSSQFTGWLVCFLISPVLAKRRFLQAERRIDTILITESQRGFLANARTSVFTFWDGSPAPASFERRRGWFGTTNTCTRLQCQGPGRVCHSTIRDARLWEQDNFRGVRDSARHHWLWRWKAAPWGPSGTAPSPTSSGPGGSYNITALQVSGASTAR